MSGPVHFLRDDDLTQEQQNEILDLADAMKKDRYAHRPLDGPKAVAVLFDKPSTRTRVSFSIGIAELGGYPLVIDAQSSQLGRGEPVEDTARVLDRQCAAIVWRTTAHARIEAMAALSRVPVVNALTDLVHPCQLLADLQTIRERKRTLAGLTLTYVGDAANNMAHSYLLAGALAGMHIRVASPVGFDPDPAILRDAQRLASEHGGSAVHLRDPRAACEGADVLATDTWVSMGQEGEYAERIEPFLPYAIDDDALSAAAPDSIVLHCLPAYRGKEISSSVLDGPQSAVWDEAENRLHAQKALLTWLLDRG